MKVDVDYDILLKGVKKLSKGLNITEDETQAVIKVLDAACGDYFPSEEELLAQEKNVKKLDTIDYDTHPLLWNQIMNECSYFENKYC